MLILRLTVACTFLIALSFLITSSLAHNATVVTDSTVGGASPSRELILSDGPSGHSSISASAGAVKRLKSTGIKAQASAYVGATQTLTFPDGSTGTPYGHWQVYAEVTGGIGRDEDCGDYSGDLSKGAFDFIWDDYPSDNLGDVSAESYGNVYNQISQSATCDVSI